MTEDAPRLNRRQQIALERPQERDRDVMQTLDPFLRKVVMVEHDKRQLQLVTILTVDLDDYPEFHAGVGFLDYNKDNRDYFVERHLWTDDLHQAAQKEMAKLVIAERGVKSAWRTKARPSEWHVWQRVTPIERDVITAMRSGAVKPTIWLKNPRNFVDV